MIGLNFRVTGVRTEPYAAVPTLMFTVAIEEVERQPIESVMLRCQLRIEPGRRRYTHDEEQNLGEIFGETSRWGDTLKPFLWTHVATVVPGFSGETTFELPVACSYDLEVAGGKYFHALEGGDVSVVFLWSGSVFMRGPAGLRVVQVPWDRESAFRLPVATWRQLMDQYFPNSGWLRLRRDTLDELVRFKARRGLPSWDDVMGALLAEAKDAPGTKEPKNGGLKS